MILEVGKGWIGQLGLGLNGERLLQDGPGALKSVDKLPKKAILGPAFFEAGASEPTLSREDLVLSQRIWRPTSVSAS